MTIEPMEIFFIVLVVLGVLGGLDGIRQWGRR